MMLRSALRLPVALCARSVASSSGEVALLQQLLDAAKAREVANSESSDEKASTHNGPAFNVKTFNAISPVGLQEFPGGKFNVDGDDMKLEGDHHAILLRSHKLQLEDVQPTVRAIARCGAGVNNIPVDKMTELGIPVFNTPGSNANAVKELVICGMLLASRGISEGIRHVHTIYEQENNEHAEVAKRIEKDKKMFVGQELTGKTLGVVGLGNIGAKVVDAALALGMNVIGYDPALSVEAAFQLPGDRMTRVGSIEQAVTGVDYLSLHVPYMPATHHLLNQDLLRLMKPSCHILNFSRGELVNGEALAQLYKHGDFHGKYVCDFADESLAVLNGTGKFLTIPHLGASTAEAEEVSAAMAAKQVKNFLETGTIENSVNFPTTKVPAPEYSSPDGSDKFVRLCIVNSNKPGVLGSISTYLGECDVNIQQQFNSARETIGYTVIDADTMAEEKAETIQLGLKSIDGVLSSRFIGDPYKGGYGTPGTAFVTVAGDR